MPTLALIGNPNSGKSSLFNLLAGTNQKVGNYPGVTVDVKSAVLPGADVEPITLLDMPGVYSMYPASAEERLVVEALLDPDHVHHPDGIIYTVSAEHLETQLLLFTQLMDLGFPLLLAVNMIDEVDGSSYAIRTEQLSKQFGVPVIGVSSRTRENIEALRTAMRDLARQEVGTRKPFYRVPREYMQAVERVFAGEEVSIPYRHFVLMHHADRLGCVSDAQRAEVEALKAGEDFQPLRAQVDETLERSERIKLIVSETLRAPGGRNFTSLLDRVVTHWLVGPLIFIMIMVLVFQAIFAWASYPMDAIESAFGWLGGQVHAALPDGWLTSLIADGLLAGLSGVLVFVPQIAILFFLVTILEEIGYMARAVYLFDRLLRRFGMNGRSMIALISGGACAIPAIMSTRTIENWKERLITILVTPFISCSARIPLFTVLVAFVVPYERVWGVFNSQGLVFTGLYVLGAVAALVSAWVFKQILQSRDASFLMLELPKFRWPDWTNVWVQVRSKSGAFVREAGKIIVLISLVLWFLASFGPGKSMEVAEQQARQDATEQALSADAAEDLVAAAKLEVSFAGRLGKVIEPAIEPLGYDWKIGIALITSFAAREVFVGSMATIYSVGTDADEFRISEHLANVRDPETGDRVFNAATSMSLLLFYLFAMQCMSTLAVVRKETGTWKWPLVQFVFMTALAYLASLAAY
ncbi:MAG: ferrous iron transport protein B, partial [Saprospiraceae bacterium]|nr:ferrous iron transport protein B [Saprospiraceae bacterium]